MLPAIIISEHEISDNTLFKQWNSNIFWAKNLTEVVSNDKNLLKQIEKEFLDRGYKPSEFKLIFKEK